MQDTDTAKESKAWKWLTAAALIIAAFSAAAGLTYVMAPVIGKPLVEFHNAHGNGKISEGDAGFYAARFMAPALAVIGLAVSIAMRKKHAPKNLAIGVACFGFLLTLAIESFLLALSGFDW